MTKPIPRVEINESYKYLTETSNCYKTGYLQMILVMKNTLPGLGKTMAVILVPMAGNNDYGKNKLLDMARPLGHTIFYNGKEIK